MCLFIVSTSAVSAQVILTMRQWSLNRYFRTSLGFMIKFFYYKLSLVYL